MREFVVDNSVFMSWLMKEENYSKASEIVNLVRENRICVPSIWCYEIANSLYVSEKRKRLNISEINEFIEIIAVFPITVESNSFLKVTTDILRMSRQYGLTAYDASYVELAFRKSIPIASFDRDIIKVSRKMGLDII